MFMHRKCVQLKLSRQNFDRITKWLRPSWLIHTAWEREWDRDRYRKLNQRNRKQWVLVPYPILGKCEHFCTMYYDPFVPVPFPVPNPVPLYAVWISHKTLCKWGTVKNQMYHSWLVCVTHGQLLLPDPQPIRIHLDARADVDNVSDWYVTFGRDVRYNLHYQLQKIIPIESILTWTSKWYILF